VDVHQRLLVVAEAAVARSACQVTRHDAVNARVLARLTRWRAEAAKEEATRLLQERVHPAG
jgi:hypothetical protein